MKRIIVIVLVLSYMAMFLNCHKTIAENDSNVTELELILATIKITSKSYLDSIDSIYKTMLSIKNDQTELNGIQIKLYDVQQSQDKRLKEIEHDIDMIKLRLDILNKRIIAIDNKLKKTQQQ